MAAAEADPLTASLAERLAALRDGAAVPATLLDLEVRRVGGLYLAKPRDWEAPDFLAAARKRFTLRSDAVADGVSLHRLAAR
jgi:hypothetical protein